MRACHLPLLSVAAILSACPTKGSDTGSSLNCTAVAVTTSDGSPDSCDVNACQACVDACGAGCSILESYPPLYSCDSDRTWDVYDFCTDWEPPA